MPTTQKDWLCGTEVRLPLVVGVVIIKTTNSRIASYCAKTEESGSLSFLSDRFCLQRLFTRVARWRSKAAPSWSSVVFLSLIYVFRSLQHYFDMSHLCYWKRWSSSGNKNSSTYFFIFFYFYIFPKSCSFAELEQLFINMSVLPGTVNIIKAGAKFVLYWLRSFTMSNFRWIDTGRQFHFCVFLIRKIACAHRIL